VAAGENPSEERKRVKQAVIVSVENLRRVAAGEPAVGSFADVANEFINKRSTPVTDGSGQVRPPRCSVGYTDGWRGRMARHVYPWIGAMPIGDVSPIHLLEVLRKIEDRGTTDTAQKVFQMLGEVMRYAVASQLIPSDPSRDLRGALTPHTVRNLPSIVEPNKVGQVIRVIRRYRGTAHRARSTAVRRPDLPAHPHAARDELARRRSRCAALAHPQCGHETAHGRQTQWHGAARPHASRVPRPRRDTVAVHGASWATDLSTTQKLSRLRLLCSVLGRTGAKAELTLTSSSSRWTLRPSDAQRADVRRTADAELTGGSLARRRRLHPVDPN
jgi:hypothetical protein